MACTCTLPVLSIFDLWNKAYYWFMHRSVAFNTHNNAQSFSSTLFKWLTRICNTPLGGCTCQRNWKIMVELTLYLVCMTSWWPEASSAKTVPTSYFATETSSVITESLWLRIKTGYKGHPAKQFEGGAPWNQISSREGHMPLVLPGPNDYTCWRYMYWSFGSSCLRV